MVRTQYEEEDNEAMELSASLAPLSLTTPYNSPTQILCMGIAPVVDAPPLPLVDICSIFEDDAVSIISIDLPFTPNHDVQVAGNKRFSNYLATDEKLINNVDSSYEREISR